MSDIKELKTQGAERVQGPDVMDVTIYVPIQFAPWVASFLVGDMIVMNYNAAATLRACSQITVYGLTGRSLGGRSVAPGVEFCGQNLGIKYIPCIDTIYE